VSANELGGKTWTRYSISIWSELRKTPEEVALAHPAQPPAHQPAQEAAPVDFRKRDAGDTAD